LSARGENRKRRGPESPIRGVLSAEVLFYSQQVPVARTVRVAAAAAAGCMILQFIISPDGGLF